MRGVSSGGGVEEIPAGAGSSTTLVGNGHTLHWDGRASSMTTDPPRLDRERGGARPRRLGDGSRLDLAAIRSCAAYCELVAANQVTTQSPPPPENPSCTGGVAMNRYDRG